MEGHAVHDDAFYVPRGLHEAWLARDPIERLRLWLAERDASFAEHEADEIASEVKRLLNESVRRAEESPLPDPASTLDGVWAEPGELDTPHHK
jgi:TPP-dependent pyruvate/acetoin dehydrogenase alpha subunit